MPISFYFFIFNTTNNVSVAPILVGRIHLGLEPFIIELFYIHFFYAFKSIKGIFRF